MVPLKNALHSYSYCSGRLGDKLYGIKKSLFPEEWRRPASYPHSHDFPQIWYCLRGEVSIVLAGKTYKLSRGQLVAVPIGMIHQIVTPEDTVAEIFCLDIRYNIFNFAPDEKYPNAKTALFFHCFLKRDFPRPIALGKESRMILHEALNQLALNSLSHVFREETCELLETVFSLPELSAEPIKAAQVENLWSQKVMPILRAMEYINEKYNEKIHSDALLRISAMGYSTFFNTFKTFLDRPFIAYQQQLRLLHCHWLFAATTYSMAYIAMLCGFSNQSHMIRNYKKYAGVLPTQARAHSYEWNKEHPDSKSTGISW